MKVQLNYSISYILCVTLTLFSPKETKSYTNTLNTLLSDSYLKPCTVISHTSPNDRLIRYVAEETAKIKGIPAAKDIKEARVVAGIRLSADEKIVNYLVCFVSLLWYYLAKNSSTNGYRKEKRQTPTKTVARQRFVFEAPL